MSKIKKSTMITAIALILCFTTLILTAYAATQNLSSYETFKNAMLDMPSLENATINGSIKLLDNGVEVLSANITSKVESHYTMSSQASYTINGDTITQEQWSDDEQTVTKSSYSDKYNVFKNFDVPMFVQGVNNSVDGSDNHDDDDDDIYVSYSYGGVVVGGREQTFDDLTPSEQKLIHAAIDMVAGDMKNYFTSDGNTITVNLDKNQIPQIAQLLVAVLGEKAGMEQDRVNAYMDNRIDAYMDSQQQTASIMDCLPKFTDDTSIQSANLTVVLDDNQNISSAKAVGAIVCTDADGVAHTLTIEVDFDISNIGTTVADTIDLTDKEIETNPFSSFTIDVGERANGVEISKFEITEDMIDEIEATLNNSIEEFVANSNDSQADKDD